MQHYNDHCGASNLDTISPVETNSHKPCQLANYCCSFRVVPKSVTAAAQNGSMYRLLLPSMRHIQWDTYAITCYYAL